MLTIQVRDYGEILCYDAVRALELLDELEQAQAAPECCLLSTHAVAGTEPAITIGLRALAGNQVMLLIDLGSTHSFINKAFVERVAAPTVTIPLVEVRVANGERLTCEHLVPAVKWWIQGQSFVTDMRELELGTYDGILGMD